MTPHTSKACKTSVAENACIFYDRVQPRTSKTSKARSADLIAHGRMAIPNGLRPTNHQPLPTSYRQNISRLSSVGP